MAESKHERKIGGEKAHKSKEHQKGGARKRETKPKPAGHGEEHKMAEVHVHHHHHHHAGGKAAPKK